MWLLILFSPNKFELVQIIWKDLEKYFDFLVELIESMFYEEQGTNLLNEKDKSGRKGGRDKIRGKMRRNMNIKYQKSVKIIIFELLIGISNIFWISYFIWGVCSHNEIGKLWFIGLIWDFDTLNIWNIYDNN